ncbi:MAG: J domain-containing protein [Fusobacteriaceae bacterium]
MISGISLLILFFIVIGIATGKSINLMPIIFLLIIILIFSFGVEVIAWLFANPFIFLIVIGLYIYNKKNQPKKQKKTHFYYKNTGTHQDFEEFFKQAGGFQYGEGGGYYKNQTGTFGETRDIKKDYENLNISENATKEEVKKAYRTAAKLHHPDKFANATEKEKEYHEKKFKEINESYENITKRLA